MSIRAATSRTHLDVRKKDTSGSNNVEVAGRYLDAEAPRKGFGDWSTPVMYR